MGTFTKSIGYVDTPPARSVRNIAVGEILTIPTVSGTEDREENPHYKDKWCVEKVYPFFVRCFRGNEHRDICLGDLVRYGYEMTGARGKEKHNAIRYSDYDTV